MVDPALAAAATGAALLSLFTSDLAALDPRLEAPDASSAVATAVAAGALAWRRSRPIASYGVMLAGSMVVSLSDHYVGLLSVLLLFSLYSLAAHGRRTVALLGLAAGALSFLVCALLDVPDLGRADLVQALALLVAAWALGDAVRWRAQLRQEHLAAVVTDERLRIARDLHDIVAHSMSLIAVQAGVGAHVIHTDPAATERSLLIIADTSRKALEQTRSMLGMLRDEDERRTRPPTQGIDDLEDLVQDVRRAGLAVDLEASGSRAALDPAASLTIYRVVQESLTNVMKHSAASTALVTLRTIADRVEVEVTDPGPARPGVGSGHGLTGLQERVRLVGGSLASGAHDQGFRVRAVVPTGTPR